MASNNQAALIALNSQTHLLRIEPELCNTIYKLVFASAETCDDALLLVSTQIRSEARSIYYSMHPFKVEVTADSLPCFAAWAAGLTHSVLVNFKKLHVVFWLDDKHLSKGLDEGLTNTLEGFSAALWISYNGGMSPSSVHTSCEVKSDSRDNPARFKLNFEANNHVSLLHGRRFRNGGVLP